MMFMLEGSARIAANIAKLPELLSK